MREFEFECFPLVDYDFKSAAKARLLQAGNVINQLFVNYLRSNQMCNMWIGVGVLRVGGMFIRRFVTSNKFFSYNSFPISGMCGKIFITQSVKRETRSRLRASLIGPGIFPGDKAIVHKGFVVCLPLRCCSH